jgi:hypothetical protein
VAQARDPLEAVWASVRREALDRLEERLQHKPPQSEGKEDSNLFSNEEFLRVYE